MAINSLLMVLNLNQCLLISCSFKKKLYTTWISIRKEKLDQIKQNSIWELLFLIDLKGETAAAGRAEYALPHSFAFTLTGGLCVASGKLFLGIVAHLEGEFQLHCRCTGLKTSNWISFLNAGVLFPFTVGEILPCFLQL